MSIFERFNELLDKFLDVVCDFNGHSYYSPLELPVDVAGQDCRLAHFHRERSRA